MGDLRLVHALGLSIPSSHLLEKFGHKLRSAPAVGVRRQPPAMPVMVNPDGDSGNGGIPAAVAGDYQNLEPLSRRPGPPFKGALVEFQALVLQSHLAGLQDRSLARINRCGDAKDRSCASTALANDLSLHVMLVCYVAACRDICVKVERSSFPETLN
eukprot:s39_g45.t1